MQLRIPSFLVQYMDNAEEYWITARGVTKKFQFTRTSAPLQGKRIKKFCREMILLKQLAQTYREIYPENVLNLAVSWPTPRTPIALKQKRWENTSYLQLGEMNNWFCSTFAQYLNVEGNLCSTFEFLQSKIGEWRRLSLAHTWLRTWQQWLMAMWFWSFHCNCKTVDNSRWPRKDKYGMVSEICNR